MFRNVWRGYWGAVSLTLMLSWFGCGGTGAAPFSGNGVLPAVTISLTPQQVAMQTNAVQPFTATVGNTSDAGVAWLINGLLGGKQVDGSYPYGQIDNNGNYTAPPYVPIPPNVTVTAAAMADNSVSASASVSLSGAYAPGTVTISPASAGVGPGGIELFTVTVNSDNKAVNWLVNNIQGGDPISVGAIYQVPGSVDQAVYIAPSPFSGSNPITVTAQSVEYPAQFASALVTVSPIKGAAVTITSPIQPPTVALEHAQAFTAKVTGVSDTAVSWEVDGIPGGNATLGTIVPGPAGTATYTAPSQLPNPQQAIVSPVSDAQPVASASMIVSLVQPPPVKVSVSLDDPCANPSGIPPDATLQFIATVSDNSAVTWQVDGVTGGNSTYGTITQDGLYTAPASVPGKPQVTISAVSQVNFADVGTLPITITAIPVLSLTISPTSATATAGQQGAMFTATVFGATDGFQAEVNWLVNGEINGGDGTYGTIAGGSPEGCVTTANYLPPATVPNPSTFPVTGQSIIDSTKSASAKVTVIPAPTITVTVAPDNINVNQSQQQAFNATVTGSSDPNVYWTLSGQNCSGAGCGTLSNSGPSQATNYTAPIQAPLVVTLTATAEADSRAQGTATINVTCGGQPTISIYPTTAAIDANNPSPLSFSVTITPCGNQSLPVSWTLGCVSLYDGHSGADCFSDIGQNYDGPGCTQINNNPKVCGSRANNYGLGTDSLDYFAPQDLFTNAFAPNVCEETNNGSGEGQVPLTATVTINQQPYTSSPACITVCAKGSSSCP